MRFEGISNALELEKKLNTIWIGNRKLHVNGPKYNKGEVSRKEWVEKQEKMNNRKVWRRKDQTQFYGKVIESGNTGHINVKEFWVKKDQHE